MPMMRSITFCKNNGNFLQAEYTTLVEEELREGETDGYYSILLKLVESVIRLQRINVSKDEL